MTYGPSDFDSVGGFPLLGEGNDLYDRREAHG
jgi:hypothetical protein